MSYVLYPNSKIPSSQLEITAYLNFNGNISIFYSATSTFLAPSDTSGINGMHREFIRATPSWRREGPQYDCIFVNSEPEFEGKQGLDIACVLAFLSFVDDDSSKEYQCALIHWFSRVGTGPDENTGLWIVEPGYDDGNPLLDIIHIDCIYRAAHLLPVYRTYQFISRSLTMHDTLDTFEQFYVNKFVDYQAFEIAF